MADLLRISGSVTAAASTGTPSGHASLNAPIDEQFAIDHARANLHYDLAADSPQSVALDGRNINFIMVKASAKVRVRITTTDGATQAIPCTFLLVKTEDVPITAIDLTRQPSVETLVDVTVGVSPT